MSHLRNKNVYALAAVLVVVAAIGTFISISVNQPKDVNHLPAAQAAQPGGTNARAGIKGIIEYTVRDSSGKVKNHGVIHNTVNNEGKNDAFNLITATGNGTYDGIAGLSVPVGTDDPSDGVLASSITLLLDGDSGTAGEQNPADGTVTTDFGTEAGNGTVQVQFTATGSATIEQIVLTRAAEDDTLVGGAAAIADADIFAYVDVPNISLAASDSVTYTWTVDVD